MTSLAEFKKIPRPKEKPTPLRAGQADVQAMFNDTLAGHELRPIEIIADGEIHRFPVGEKSNLDGYYSLTIAEYGGRGIFGNWQIDVTPHHWTSYTENELSPPQLAKIRRQRAKEQRTDADRPEFIDGHVSIAPVLKRFS